MRYFVSVQTRSTSNLLNECKHLDIISQFVAGYDNINVAEVTRLGIPLGYAPGAMSDLLQTLHLAWCFPYHASFFTCTSGSSMENGVISDLRQPEWKWRENPWHFWNGLDRYGNGSCCKGCLWYEDHLSHRRRDQKRKRNLTPLMWVLEELLKQSDVTQSCAYGDERGNKGIFNKHAFALMKPNIYLHQYSTRPSAQWRRSDWSLEQGNDLGAGLDVTNPRTDEGRQPIIENGECSSASAYRIGYGGSEKWNVATGSGEYCEFYKNGKVPNIINPEVLKWFTSHHTHSSTSPPCSHRSPYWPGVRKTPGSSGNYVWYRRFLLCNAGIEFFQGIVQLFRHLADEIPIGIHSYW